jgi:hypothetical protein
MVEVSLALAFVLGRQTPALDRYARWASGNPDFRVRIEAAIEGTGPRASGVFEMARPLRQRLSLSGPDIRVEYRQTAEGTLELDLAAKRSFATGPVPELAAPNGIGADWTDFFHPSFLLPPRLERAFPPRTPSRLVGRETIGGVAADRVEFGGEEDNQTFWIDTEGRVVLYRRAIDNGGSKLAYRLSFREWSRAAPSSFGLLPPDGFQPVLLADSIWSIAVGSRWGWQGVVENGRPARPPARRQLIMLTQSGCAPSAAAIRYLTRLERLPVVEVTIGSAGPGLADPSGVLRRRLGVEGTPVFLLVDRESVVRRIWFGFDSATGERWANEVRRAAEKA